MTDNDDDVKPSYLEQLTASAKTFERLAAVEAEGWNYTWAARYRGRVEGLRQAIELFAAHNPASLMGATALSVGDDVQLAESLVEHEPAMRGVIGKILKVHPTALDVVHVLFDGEDKGRLLTANSVVKVK